MSQSLASILARSASENESQDAELSAIRRNRRAAEALTAQAINGGMIRAPSQGIAQLVQALGGGVANVIGAFGERDLTNQRASEESAFLARRPGASPVAAALAGPAPEAPPPVAATPPVSQAATPSPVLPNVPARGEAPPVVSQGIAARAALDPNSPTYPEDIQRINNVVTGGPGVLPGARPQPVVAETPVAAAAAPAPSGGAPAATPTPTLSREDWIREGLASRNPRLRQMAADEMRLMEVGDRGADRAADNRRAEAALELQRLQFAASQGDRAAQLALQRRQLELAEEGARSRNLPAGYRMGANGQAEPIPGVPQAPAPGTPPGYERSPNGEGLRPIPGGPSDPSTVAAGAAARRPEAPTGYEPNPTGEGLRPIPGGPADPTVLAAAATARQPESRPLSDTAINRLSGLAGLSNEWSGLNDTFKDTYGGYTLGAVGNAANALTRNTGIGDQQQADWWQRYNLQANQVRNELFGTALTAPEKAAFDAAMITPGMTPAQIRLNLGRQAAIARAGIERQGRAMIANGSNRRTVEALLGFPIGDEPPSASVPTEPNAGAPRSGQQRTIRYDAQGNRIP